jgi:hypothetical protein
VKVLGAVILFAVTGTGSPERNEAGNADECEENDLVQSEP